MRAFRGAAAAPRHGHAGATEDTGLQPFKPRHLPELDGLRAAAVLLVLWAHFPYVAGSTTSLAIWKFGQALRTGYIGVDLFFVLSGFLITRILLAERDSAGSISFGKFYLKRVLRIFPIYYLCVAIYILTFAHGDGDVLSLATYTFNYYKPFHPAPSALEHTWSLSVEEQFYLLWPLIISATPRSWGRALTGAVIPAIGLATALIVAACLDNALAANVIYMSGPTRMISLSLGAYLAFREVSAQPLAGMRAAGLVVLGVVVLAADNAGRALHYVPAGGFYWSAALVGYAALSMGTVALVIGADNPVAAPIKAVLRLRPLRYIGKISYGLYLYHYLILFLFGLAPYQTEGVGTSLALASAALVTTFAVAALSFQLLEGPLLRLKDRLSTSPLPWRLLPARTEPAASDLRSGS